MKLSKNKVAGGVLGLLAIVSIVNTQAIVSLTNYVRGDSSNGMSLDGSNQSAQVVNFSTKTTENAVYKRGDKSDVILQVQKALTSKGLYKGDISGLMGPKTERAVKDFQTKNGLTATGNLDQNTISAVLRGGGSGTNTGPGMSALPACNRNSEPWIRVLSPNGGEVYQAGEEINVTWRKCNVPAGVDVGITLLNEVSGQPLPTFVNHVQIEQTPNDGSQIISASAMQGLSPFEYGNRFKVRLNYVVTNSYDWQTYGNNPAWMQNGDESNNLFTIIDEEGCAEGTIIGYDSNGVPIYCGGGPGTAGCIDTGMNANPPNNRTYSFSEWDPSVATTEQYGDGETALLGDYKITVGGHTVCTLELITIYSITNPVGYISQVTLKDIDTNQVLGVVPASAFIPNGNGFPYSATINFGAGAYPLEANSIKRLGLFADIETSTQAPFGEITLVIGIGAINHAYGNGAMVWGKPIFQKAARIYNFNQ